MSIGSSPIIPRFLPNQTMNNTLIKFKKNSKFIRLNKLYFDLLKTKHILNFFIGGIKQHQLSRLYRIVATQHLFLNFLTKLEYRIEFILLKCGFVLTGKQARQIILHKHVFLNGSPVKTCSTKIKVGDLVSLSSVFSSKYKFFLICNLFKTPLYFNFLKKKKISKKYSIQRIFIYFKFSLFLETNFQTFSLIIVRPPVLQEFFLPKVISLYDLNQLRFVL
jgi:ribosomal protein S4